MAQRTNNLPCDFSLWDYLKQLVHHDEEVINVEELQQRIENI